MQILIIEDENELRELMEYNLSRQNYQVVTIDNANDALIMIEDCPPDLILLDLMLPGLQGMQFLDIFREKDKATPVIIISARIAEEDIVKGLDHGADDYLPKPFSIKILEAKVKAAFRRSAERKGVVSLASGGVTVDIEAHRAAIGQTNLQLTQKEFDLLSLFIRKPEKVFTRNQLLNIIWGYEADLISRTVDAHVAMLRKKLGEKGVYIKTVPKIGYLWEVRD
jgi:two-component system phosphate regulon response regulator PhoB